MTDRVELYKACKYEVENFREDHGMSLPEMWAVVNDRAPEWKRMGVQAFWKATCLRDYREQRIW